MIGVRALLSSCATPAERRPMAESFSVWIRWASEVLLPGDLFAEPAGRLHHLVRLAVHGNAEYDEREENGREGRLMEPRRLREKEDEGASEDEENRDVVLHAKALPR